jgi:hypothetical protein
VLHRLGVVHRDVKPGNVLLTPGGDVKLTDFGLARHWEGDESRATETEGLVGTIDYLAPEQALGQDVDARTDLYSAGVLLFELLAGEPPLRGGSKLGTIVAHLRQKAPDVRTRRPDVPAWLAAFVARLLEKDPSRRYPTAAAAVADLRAGRVKRRQARRWLLAGAGLLASVAILWDHWTPRREALPTLETDGRLLRAVDSRGRTLWRRDDVLRERTAWIRRARGAGPVLAAIVGSGADLTLEARHTLSFLDSLSGRALGSLTFSSDAPRSFPGFSDHYGVCPLVTHDVDGDGLDEVFVTYAHDPYWPSYTVVCDPSRGLSRTLLVASGHHRVLGFADVDGDGREEALIAGINNRMGWFVGLAAVPVSSFSGSPGRATADAVTTPDRPDFGATLAAGGGWYALTAPGVRPALEVDRARRSIRVRSSAERVTELGFDGFPVAVSSRLTPSARAAARIEAYSRLVEERRLEGAGNTPEALREAGMARDAAARADDPPLLDVKPSCWCGVSASRTPNSASRRSSPTRPRPRTSPSTRHSLYIWRVTSIRRSCGTGAVWPRPRVRPGAGRRWRSIWFWRSGRGAAGARLVPPTAGAETRVQVATARAFVSMWHGAPAPLWPI